MKRSPYRSDEIRQTLRVRLAWLLLIPMLLIADIPASAASTTANRRPNIVILLADDLGYAELGCQGCVDVPTPHIDSIAAAGVRFTDGYVTAPYCSASRAGLLTGRYQTRFGYEFNPVGAQNDDPNNGLPIGERTLANYLQDAGYTTALVGKWHLGATARYHPLRRGFDEFFGFLHEGHFYVPPPYRGVTTWIRRKTLPNGGQGRWHSQDGLLVYSTHMHHNEPAYDANNPIFRGGTPVRETAYLTDAWTRQAVDFIDRCKDRPFFLYLAYNAVHSPMQGADAYMKRFQNIDDVHRRIFAAMLANLDDSVGTVLRKLHDEGLENDTLVFFLSDNGGPTRELTSSNRPLRGEKGDMWEGGIRIPFLVRWPGHIPAGNVYRYPVISLDMFATALKLARVEKPKNLALDGVDLIPYLDHTRTERPHETLFWRLNQRTAIRVGDWKLVRSPGHGGDADWHLYNLAEDISESRDQVHGNPRRFQALLAAWQTMNQQMPARRQSPLFKRRTK